MRRSPQGAEPRLTQKLATAVLVVCNKARIEKDAEGTTEMADAAQKTDEKTLVRCSAKRSPGTRIRRRADSIDLLRGGAKYKLTAARCQLLAGRNSSRSPGPKFARPR